MRLFGHPVHPMLVHFPIALWSLAALGDGLVLFGFEIFQGYGSFCLALGLAVAIPAMAAGFLDLAALPAKAERDGRNHMLLMGAAWTAFLIGLVTRYEDGALVHEPNALSVGCTMAGLALMLAGAWFGGQLVYRHGAGQHASSTALNENLS